MYDKLANTSFTIHDGETDNYNGKSHFVLPPDAEMSILNLINYGKVPEVIMLTNVTLSNPVAGYTQPSVSDVKKRDSILTAIARDKASKVWIPGIYIHLTCQKEALIYQGFFCFYLEPQWVDDSALIAAYSYKNGSCPKIIKKMDTNSDTKIDPHENLTGSHGGSLYFSAGFPISASISLLIQAFRLSPPAMSDNDLPTVNTLQEPKLPQGILGYLQTGPQQQRQQRPFQNQPQRHLRQQHIEYPPFSVMYPVSATALLLYGGANRAVLTPPPLASAPHLPVSCQIRSGQGRSFYFSAGFSISASISLFI